MNKILLAAAAGAVLFLGIFFYLNSRDQAVPLTGQTESQPEGPAAETNSAGFNIDDEIKQLEDELNKLNSEEIDDSFLFQ